MSKTRKTNGSNKTAGRGGRRRFVVGGLAVLIAGAMVAPGMIEPFSGSGGGTGGAAFRAAASTTAIGHGADAAPVTVEMYGSLTCGACASAHADTLPALEPRVADGSVRIVHAHYPLDRLALAGAMLVSCLPEERRWAGLGMLYDSQSEWAQAESPRVVLERKLAQAGLGAGDVEACLADQGLAGDIRDAQEIAQSVVGIRATPTFRVIGPGGMQTLRGAVAGERVLEAVADVR